MSANADNVRFKLACNVQFCAYFEKFAFSGKNIVFTKMAYGLGKDISLVNFPVVSDF